MGKKCLAYFTKDRNQQNAVTKYAFFQIVAEFPRDLVSLKRGQVLCFYMGKQEEMLQLALQVSHVSFQKAHWKPGETFSC